MSDNRDIGLYFTVVRPDKLRDGDFNLFQFFFHAGNDDLETFRLIAGHFQFRLFRAADMVPRILEKNGCHGVRDSHAVFAGWHHGAHCQISVSALNRADFSASAVDCIDEGFDVFTQRFFPFDFTIESIEVCEQPVSFFPVLRKKFFLAEPVQSPEQPPPNFIRTEFQLKLIDLIGTGKAGHGHSDCEIPDMFQINAHIEDHAVYFNFSAIEWTGTVPEFLLICIVERQSDSETV